MALFAIWNATMSFIEPQCLIRKKNFKNRHLLIFIISILNYFYCHFSQLNSVFMFKQNK